MRILSTFAHASGLVTNFINCAIYPMACTALQLEGLLDVIQPVRQAVNYTIIDYKLE